MLPHSQLHSRFTYKLVVLHHGAEIQILQVYGQDILGMAKYSMTAADSIAFSQQLKHMHSYTVLLETSAA